MSGMSVGFPHQKIRMQEIIIEKSPLAPLFQRGEHCLPLAKGGKEGFYK
jgi:hypothetical protein